MSPTPLHLRLAQPLRPLELLLPQEATGPRPPSLVSLVSKVTLCSPVTPLLQLAQLLFPLDLLLTQAGTLHYNLLYSIPRNALQCVSPHLQLAQLSLLLDLRPSLEAPCLSFFAFQLSRPQANLLSPHLQLAQLLLPLDLLLVRLLLGPVAVHQEAKDRERRRVDGKVLQ